MGLIATQRLDRRDAIGATQGISTDNTVPAPIGAIAAPNAVRSCDPASVKEPAISPDTTAHGTPTNNLT